MVRQPYSKAVPSTGGRLHPLAPEGFCPPELGGTEGGVKTIEERLGENGGAFFNGKEGFCPLKEGTEGSVKTIEEDRDERWILL